MSETSIPSKRINEWMKERKGKQNGQIKASGILSTKVSMIGYVTL